MDIDRLLRESRYIHLSNDERITTADPSADQPVEAVDSVEYALPSQIGMTLTEICP